MTVDGFGFGTLTGESCLKNAHCHTDRASWDAILVTVVAFGALMWKRGDTIWGGGSANRERDHIYAYIYIYVTCAIPYSCKMYYVTLYCTIIGYVKLQYIIVECTAIYHPVVC